MENRVLLENYLTQRSHEAFTELVKRHIPLVYSTALRITSQPATAEDVAQSVFIRLARHAPTLREGNALPGWLYRTTCHTAYNVLRSEKRRHEYESAAMQITEILQNSSSVWEHLSPLLDEGMARLSDADQDIIIQRFFEGRSLREVGEALGLSDDAAQKRVHRALEKLRLYFSQNGVAIPALLLIPAISEHAIHLAPNHVAPQIATTAHAASTVVSGNVFLKLLAFMCQTKIKTSLAAAGIVMLLSYVAWYLRFSSRPSSGKRDAFMPTLPVALGPVIASKPVVPSASVEPPAVASAKTYAPTQSPTSLQTSANSAAISIAVSATEPRARLDTAIIEAIRTLTDGDYLLYLKEFDPPDWANDPDRRPIEEIAQDMGQRDSFGTQTFLNAIISIQGQAPMMSDNGNTATYEAAYFDGGTREVVLKKNPATGLWYIQGFGAFLKPPPGGVTP